MLISRQIEVKRATPRGRNAGGNRANRGGYNPQNTGYQGMYTPMQYQNALQAYVNYYQQGQGGEYGYQAEGYAAQGDPYGQEASSGGPIRSKNAQPSYQQGGYYDYSQANPMMDYYNMYNYYSQENAGHAEQTDAQEVNYANAQPASYPPPENYGNFDLKEPAHYDREDSRRGKPRGYHPYSRPSNK